MSENSNIIQYSHDKGRIIICWKTWILAKHFPPAASCPFLTLASRALSQACLNSSCPFASFSCCRAISSWSFLSLTCASSFSHWECARISLNCFCKSARLFPKTSEGLWILLKGERRWYKCDIIFLMLAAGCKHAVNISAGVKSTVWTGTGVNLQFSIPQCKWLFYQMIAVTLNQEAPFRLTMLLQDYMSISYI